MENVDGKMFFLVDEMGFTISTVYHLFHISFFFCFCYVNCNFILKLQDVVVNFQSWKELAEKFDNYLTKQELSLKDGLQKVVEQLGKWSKEFERVVR